MKFLCDNCKAKYQIPDEKVAGRTLRMTCRKCGNDILIRGAGVTPSVAPPAAAPAPAPAVAPVAVPAPAAGLPKAGAVAAKAPAPPPAKVPAAVAKASPATSAAAPAAPAAAAAAPAPAPAPAKAAKAAPAPAASAKSAAAAPIAAARPSALGADFRKKVGNEDAGSLRASPAAPLPAASEEWHVAIHDVPVGPIRRDEIARKIGTGAVTGDSLAWREGFDDWRPLRDIPQLASLLEQRRRPSVPPVGRATSASVSQRPSGPRGRSGSGAITLPSSDRSSASLVPQGGRAAAPVAPPANTLQDAPESNDDFALDFASPSSIPPAPLAPVPVVAAAVAPAAVAAARVPAAKPIPAAVTPVQAATPVAAPVEPHGERERDSHKTPVWVWGMLAGGIFFGVVLGMKGSEWFGSRPVEVAVTDPTPALATPEPVPAVEQPLALPDEDMTPDAGALEPEAATPSETGRPGTSSSGRTTTTPIPAAPSMTSSGMVDDGAFAQFESVGGMTVTPSELTANMSAASAPPLDQAAVQRVVTNNRRTLQTCYERAARGQANPPRARMDVNVTVGRSGTVTTVSATGDDFGGLSSCIEQSVRRWRFPASSDGGATRFPVVFSAGG